MGKHGDAPPKRRSLLTRSRSIDGTRVWSTQGACSFDAGLSVANPLSSAFEPIDSTRHSGEIQLQRLGEIEVPLPSKSLATDLAGYHEHNLLWCHGSYDARLFEEQLRQFYAHPHSHSEADLQWCALFFAVLLGSIVTAPSTQWGLANTVGLAEKWFKIAIMLLGQSHNADVLSLQTIATLAVSADMLPCKADFWPYLARAIEMGTKLELTPDHPRELGTDSGREAWRYILAKFWFSLAFTKEKVPTAIPFMRSLPSLLQCNAAEPLDASYRCFLWDVANLIPMAREQMEQKNTAYTRYLEVQQWDNELRSAIEKRPIFLEDTPIDPTWPHYAPMARLGFAILSNYMVLVLHWQFLAASLEEPRHDPYQDSWGKCIHASMKIMEIMEQYHPMLQNGWPMLRIYQRSFDTASIVLRYTNIATFSIVGVDREPGRLPAFLPQGSSYLEESSTALMERKQDLASSGTRSEVPSIEQQECGEATENENAISSITGPDSFVNLLKDALIFD